MEKPTVSGKAAPPEKVRTDTDTMTDSSAKARLAGENIAVEPSDDEAADFLLDKDAPTEVNEALSPASKAESPQTQTKTEVMRPEEVAAPASSAKTPPPPPRPPTAPKSVVLGDYRLLKKLGQGGMGSVYKAHQISLDRDVAVKVLSKELAAKPAFVQRFLREARLMAKLDHPNILRCYDVGEALGYHFLSMEFVEGGTVDEWLRKQHRFKIEDALCLTLAVATALQHAHDLNLVHRDIKPENILLTKRGVIKVADLGLAKARDDDMSMTRTGMGAGTPLFMAPEQARDAKHVDGRVDIYALGCMLYVFLTGKPPFEGATVVELVEAKEKGKVTPVRQHNDEVPERLGLIIEKMMASKAEHRYQSCAEVILELEALGLAGPRLSFFPQEGPSVKPAGRIGPKKISVPRMLRGTPSAASAPVEAPKEESFWYANLTVDGKTVTRKLTKDQLVGMVKSQAVDADTPVSRARGGPFRSLGTYSEFGQFVKAKIVKERAEKKAEKFKALYDKIDREEKSRLRWRWIHNLYLKAGGFVGLLLWLAVVAGILIAGYFLVRWGFDLLREKLGVG